MATRHETCIAAFDPHNSTGRRHAYLSRYIYCATPRAQYSHSFVLARGLVCRRFAASHAASVVNRILHTAKYLLVGGEVVRG